MKREQELWELEKEFWRGDAEFYERTLADKALMVFPAPIGIMDRATAVGSIRSAARWRNVSFRDKHLLPAGQGAVVLAYCVQADRGGKDSRYAAHCSSVYTRGDGGWHLVLHQQTPSHEGRAGT